MRTSLLILSVALLLCLPACTDGGQDTATQPTPTLPADTSSTAPTPTGALNPPPTPSQTTRFCTEIGCESVLTIELAAVEIVPEETYGIDICVDQECVSETITIDVPHPGTGEIIRGESDRPRRSLEGWILVWADGDYIEFHLPDQEYGETVEVSFSLNHPEGQVLAEAENEEVPLERSQPNGPGCPPICFTGRLII